MIKFVHAQYKAAYIHLVICAVHVLNDGQGHGIEDVAKTQPSFPLIIGECPSEPVFLAAIYAMANFYGSLEPYGFLHYQKRKFDAAFTHDDGGVALPEPFC